jgi:hypothetical protein
MREAVSEHLIRDAVTTELQDLLGTSINKDPEADIGPVLKEAVG